jgi:hypothetical protein
MELPSAKSRPIANQDCNCRSKPFSFESLADKFVLAAEGPCWDDGIDILSATPDWICVVARCEMSTAER